MNVIKLAMPFGKDELSTLNAGDIVYITGKILVMRDAGHKRLFEYIKRGEMPFDYNGRIIYYMGPCPNRKGEVIGSCGPTTTTRMDKYTPYLLDTGLLATIGKGDRNDENYEAIVRNKSVYFAAIGGAGALYKNTVKDVKTVCFDDLLAEDTRELTVEDFPVVVAIDSKGNSVYRN